MKRHKVNLLSQDDDEHDAHHDIDRRGTAERKALRVTAPESHQTTFAVVAPSTSLIEWSGPHIAQYNAKRLFRFDFLAMKGTVFDLRHRFVWVQLLILFSMAAVVGIYQVSCSGV